MSGFRIGALVLVKSNVPYEAPALNARGQITHIIDKCGQQGYDWVLAIKSTRGSNVIAAEHALILIDDDGKQKTTWDECPWQPKVVKEKS